MAEIEVMNMIQSLNQALDMHMEAHDNAVILGEDVGYFGGVFRVTQGLQKKYGADRVLDTPLSECAIVGSAIGMALGGLHPIVEIQFADFVFPAFDQIVSELSKYRYRSGGQYPIKLLMRMPYGGGIKGGHYHSQSPEAFFAHLPGLKVVIPSGPYEAKGLLLEALNTPDPVIFLEPKRVYRTIKAKVPTAFYTLPIGKAHIAKKGADITVVGYGAMVDVIQQAAHMASAQNIDVEVIDLLSLVPFDSETICRSIEKTGRLVVVHEAPQTGGFAGEIMATVQEKVFHRLEAPLKRVTGFDMPFPYIHENHYMPTPDRVLDAVCQTMAY
jgi:pyruvate dehydrogenase E1 component beta subunit